MTWSDWRSLYRSQGSRAAMLVPSCVWRSALLRHRALQHVLHGCRGVTSRLLYVAAIRQSPPGAEQSNVRLLYTSQALRQIRKPTNPVPRSPEAPPQTTVQKVTQAGMDITFFFVVVAGAIVTAGLIYFVIQELFSSSSPSRIYGKALVKCQNHPEVIGAFGEPIKGHGEPTTRGRRQHVIVPKRWCQMYALEVLYLRS
ncbi:mitochondrial import inner membrane translocase subunit Tim21 isoform 1-T1 [Gastrophryne carolinensis]